MSRFVVTRGCAAALALALLPCAISAQAFTESTLYSFSTADGVQPVSVIQASDGNFYGTAYFGGTGWSTTCPQLETAELTFTDFWGCGTIFKVTPAGGFSVLHNLNGTSDGSQPGPLVEGSDGNLYGVALEGGVNSSGTFFRITPSGSFTVLYPFTGGANGAYPIAITLANDGNFYGTTIGGGSLTVTRYGYGTIFKITPSGTFTSLYSFSGGSPDGGTPDGLVQGSDGFLYGSTQEAGNASACANPWGTVFKFSLTAKTISTLNTFCATVVNPQDAGVASSSQAVNPDISLPTKAGTGGQGVTGLWTPGLNPKTLTEGSDGNFYGTSYGYYYDSDTEEITLYPTIFKISPTGTLKNFYTFSEPSSGSLVGLTLGSDGNFYGTSATTVFQMTPAGVITTMFTAPTGTSTSALSPYLLIQASDGDIYGALPQEVLAATTTVGGTIFELEPAASMPAPVQLTFSSATVAPGTAVTLDWSVVNGFSATMQQCYAFVQGNTPGAGTWTGLQTGTVSDSAYSGSASITPTQAGTYTYALTCGGQESGFATLTALPPAVTTTTLPGGYTTVAYSATLAVDNGLAPYNWSVTAGALPAGLTLNATTGAISGTPTQAGTSNFTVTVKDSESQPLTGTANLSLTVVAAAVSANPSSLSIAAPGSSASTMLTISGFATSSITFSCSGLPSEAACTFGNPTVSNGSETVSLQVSTTAASSARLLAPSNKQRGNMLYALALPGAIWLGCLCGARRRRYCRYWTGLLVVLFLTAAISMTACGGGGSGGGTGTSNSGTPVGTSTVVVTATGGAQTVTMNLSVNVQ